MAEEPLASAALEWNWESRRGKRAYLKRAGFCFGGRGISKAMQKYFNFPASYNMRTPADPVIPPIQEPTDPPENPDVPVREPDPEDPGQI